MILRSAPVVYLATSASQPEPQTHLMTFQPAPRNWASSSWTTLPLPRTGPSRRCRLQLMTNTRLSSFSRAAREIAPVDSGSSISPSPINTQTFRFSVFARPKNRPNLAVFGVRQPAAVQVFQEAGLVDRHQGPEAHRDRRELPVVRH